MLTKSDFIEWRDHPATKAVYESIRLRIGELQGEIAVTAGINAREDGIKVGAIAAYNDFLALDLELEAS